MLSNIHETSSCIIFVITTGTINDYKLSITSLIFNPKKNNQLVMLPRNRKFLHFIDFPLSEKLQLYRYQTLETPSKYQLPNLITY